MQVDTPTLEEAAQAFQAWRSNKHKKSEPIPQYLKQLLPDLVSLYPRSHIMKTLSISSSTLYASSISPSHKLNVNRPHNLKANYNKDQELNNNINFIPFEIANPETGNASNDSAEIAEPPPSIICEIIKPNGTKLIVHTQDFSKVISTFLCCN